VNLSDRLSKDSEALRPDGLAPDIPARPYWGPGRLGIIVGLVVRLVVFLVVWMGAAQILTAIVSNFVASEIIEAPVSVPGALMTIATTSGAYFLVVRFLERRRSIYELSSRRLGGLGIGLAGGAVAILVCCGIIALAGGYQWSVAENSDLGDIAVVILGAGIGAGIAEELVFRGIAYRLMEQLFGTWAAFVGSGLLFGIMHITNPGSSLWGGISVALAGGLLFGVIYALTRSLWVTIGYHAAWNVVQGPLLGVPVSGNELPAFLQTTVNGPDWLTGGAFGAEGSVITVVLMFGVTIALVVLLVRRGGDNIVPPLWSARRNPELSSREEAASPASSEAE
jgi:abortive infection protein